MTDPTSYFYEADDERSRAVLRALRLYRAADAAMRRRTQDSMSMGENELLVIRYLLRARGAGRSVSPKDISAYLGMPTASTTALLDRLEKSGHLVRVPHPHDRRSVQLQATERADDEVRATLGAMHDRMLSAVADLTPQQAGSVITFLGRMQEAVDGIAPPRHSG